MTAKSTSLTPSPAMENAPTFATVLDLIAADEGLTKRRRQDVCSALRTLARLLRRRPEETPAHPVFVRDQFKRLNAAMAGVSSARWSNISCLAAFALRRAGLADVPGRYTEPMTEAWSDLFERLKGRHQRYALSRPARFCGAKGIAPGEVTDKVFDLYLEDLEHSSLTKNPRKVHKSACRAWNTASANTAGWPPQRIKVPDYRTKYVLPWETFPQSLKVEIDAFLRSRSDTDAVSEIDSRPLKPSSIATHARQLHEYVSALAHRGIDPLSLGSIADITEVETFKEGLRFINARSKSARSKHACDIAGLVTALAAHWVHRDSPHLGRMKSICRNLRTPAGMTEKNALRLRQFDDPRNVRALLTLPQRVVARAPGKSKPVQRALEVQSALAVEILLMLPLRMGNLAALDLDRHIKRTRRGVVHIGIPKSEVKNDVAIEATLPKESARLLATYLEKHRPVLYDGPSRAIFPSRAGEPKSISSLGWQISTFIRRECGLDVHPHLFRHLSAKLYLDEHPGAYGFVRLLHGHKSVDTTTTYYCGREAAAAQQRFDDHVLKLRGTPPPALPTPLIPKK